MTFDELQQIVQNLASTTSEAHWKFQEDLQAMKGRHEALEKLVVQIAEGTARLLTTVQSHEARLSRLEGTE